jgi:F0F1-type ATP synthase assembly protein I
MVDHGFISGVMVSMLVSSEVDHGFISGVMVSMLVSSVVDREFSTTLEAGTPNHYTTARLVLELTIYQTRSRHA